MKNWQIYLFFLEFKIRLNEQKLRDPVFKMLRYRENLGIGDWSRLSKRKFFQQKKKISVSTGNGGNPQFQRIVPMCSLSYVYFSFLDPVSPNSPFPLEITMFQRNASETGSNKTKQNKKKKKKKKRWECSAKNNNAV